MNTNNRRPDGWTSADAAGLAIFPGLVRYDEAWGPTVTEIGHAFRVTVRATHGYVYPASHQAGSNPATAVALASLTLSAASIKGGRSVTGTVALSAPAPAGSVIVTLSSSKTALASVPSTVLVSEGTISNSFTITTSSTRKSASVTIAASYAGVTKSATLSVAHR